MGNDEKLVPDFRIKIKGAPLPKDVASCVRWTEIQQSIEKIDMAVICLENQDGTIADMDLFDYGNEVVIEGGWVGAVETLFTGEIISLEPDFPEGAGSPTVTVQAFDKLHKYRRKAQTRTFLKQKVSDVIKSLAGEEGLSAQVEATQSETPYLIQNNQTNIDYLQELARRSGFEVSVVDGSKLNVGKGSYDKGSGLTLTWGEDLTSFYVRKSLANVPSEVSTRYWDMKKKEEVVQKVDTIRGSLGPKSDAHKEAAEAFGAAKVQISHRPCTSPEEAEALAGAALNQAALDAVKGRGTSYGRTALKPGVVLTLEGLGDIWSGDYYVVGATHVHQRSTGYSTGFDVQRTGT